ncbi:MAG: EamA family transporter [bacterium]|jgi:drug/metabolite transporter (DMT)-like permease
MKESRQNLYSWAILLGLVIVWGSSFILIKRSLLYFEAAEVGILRVVITFLAVMPFAFNMLRKISQRMMWYLIISGSVGSLIPAILFAIAQTKIDSALAGTLNALTPLFTLLLGISFFGIRTRWYNVVGVLIGLAGAVGLIYANSQVQLSFDVKYALLVVLATICYAFNVNWIKIYLKELNALTITVLTFFYIGIPLLVYVLFFSDIPHKLVDDPDNLTGLGYLVILSVIGTGLALVAFNKLIKVSSPVFAASVTYMIPIVAILWGIIDGEVFKLSYALWFGVILVGVLLVNTSPRRKFALGTRLLLRKRMRDKRCMVNDEG